ncbi:MGMT family protein [Serpentinicella alkaliphila]|uniref:6-O-methylguanine DNA methyltransferase-like protein n=1 Tax=Serpentinicella alkaliphila TaxID=1734049 RepID=A0A4R2THH1_9FIRM|nr:MGMT family protein [Serpentinicella alkaliphila]QUH26202.1 MGMT family protein [Serpentinicella alkaliphila]TCQ01662.1 6-O-methylguanine DNA methyltransferase-like protein [Serpentinicella alkaliphila]
MPKKTYMEKLYNSGDLPKIEFIDFDNKMAKRFGYGNMLIAPPIEYDEVMRKIPEGKLTTVDEVRMHLSKKHNADFTCRLTAGIFINIVGNASQERENSGSKDITPYWRTLKKDGELNEKYPGGIDQQKMLLELEGHEVIKKGKRYFVKDYMNSLFQLNSI